MRILLWTISFVILSWSAYWVIGAKSIKSELSESIQKFNSGDWSIEYSDAIVRGFPYRFDVTINNLTVKNKKNYLTWTLPYFQILSLSYSPKNLILVWPKEQELKTKTKTINLTSNKMLASIERTNIRSYDISKFILEVEGAIVKSSQDLVIQSKSLILAIDKLKVETAAYKFGLSSTELSIQPSDHRFYGLVGLFNTNSLNLNINADVYLDTLLRVTKKQDYPKITKLNLKEISINSKDFILTAMGNLETDIQGSPEGDIQLKISDWKQLLSNIKKTGINKKIIESLRIFSILSGNQNNLTLDLTLKERKLLLGPLLLGSIPKQLIQ
ncbi:MAG: DUF2125 domain-containing protein [Paracoccaceae bacterium]|nr:DUF2125 domain-containing protein [Paracoccaceae bacterium]